MKVSLKVVKVVYLITGAQGRILVIYTLGPRNDVVKREAAKILRTSSWYPDIVPTYSR